MKSIYFWIYLKILKLENTLISMEFVPGSLLKRAFKCDRKCKERKKLTNKKETFRQIKFRKITEKDTKFYRYIETINDPDKVVEWSK